MRYIISLSGGKDSTACAIWALEHLRKEDLEFVFLDTKWEHEDTYKYLDYLEKTLNINIIRLESEGMFEVVKRRSFMPNVIMRFCTTELKIKPFNKYIYTNYVLQDRDFIVIKGIRRDESSKRSNYQVFSDERAAYNYKRFRVKSIYPIVDWSTEDVFKYLEENKVKRNSLYDKGFTRVGCYPCVFATKKELKLISKDKQYLDRVSELEQVVSEAKGTTCTFFKKPINEIIKD